MAKHQWKTLRVVVEIPVQGDLTEKQLAYEVSAALGAGDIYHRLQHYRPHIFSPSRMLGPERAKTGVFRVKQFGHVKAALTRTIFGRL